VTNPQKATGVNLFGALALLSIFIFPFRTKLFSIEGVIHVNGWEERFDGFLKPFFEAWRSRSAEVGAALSARLRCLESARSIEPLAERVAPWTRARTASTSSVSQSGTTKPSTRALGEAEPCWRRAGVPHHR